jgi:hypothetical protein
MSPLLAHLGPITCSLRWSAIRGKADIREGLAGWLLKTHPSANARQQAAGSKFMEVRSPYAPPVSCERRTLPGFTGSSRTDLTYRRLSPQRRQNWVGGNVSFDRTSLMPPTLGASNSNSTDAFAIVMLQMCAKRFVMSCCKRATTAVPLRRGLCYGPRRGTRAVTFLKSASTLGGLEVSPSFCAALFSAVNAQDISTRGRKVRRLRCHQLDQSNTGL